MLTGLSWLYAKVIDARNSLYSRKLIHVEQLPAPTISVGNITVGGTGKTPLVEFISRYFAKKNETVCVISRGYKRKDESKRVLVSDKSDVLVGPQDAGDEPYELALRLRGKAYVVADPDRAAAAKWAHNEFGITLFVLDDAFQHRRAGRDLDIVVVDATNPFGGFKTLPSGRLRERPQNLARADLVVVTRSNLCDDISVVKKAINDFAPGVDVHVSRNNTEGFHALDNFRVASTVLQKSISKPAFVFCGIGNPSVFFEQLSKSGVEILGTKEFRDHHWYDASDAAKIQESAIKVGASVLITTPKDAVKLDPSSFQMPCFVCETGLSFDDEKGLTEILDKALIR